MRAGRLRQRVTIQSKSVVQDSYGAEVITWGNYLTCWAAVEPVRGREFAELQMAGAETHTRMVIRWPGDLDVTTDMRLVHGSRYYDIESVIRVDERRREVQLMCRELDSAAWAGGQ